jgi:hypothetical protein
MAKPANDLDKYVTYTYHFELHCARNWDELKTRDGVISEAATTRYASNGTLLINTRKDAHQTIDEVNFDCISPSSSPGDAPTGLAELKMTVKEPGGFSFIEKLKTRMNELDITAISDAVFGLKIIFVGRSADNNIDLQHHLRTIPLCLINMSGNFTQEGGLYQLDFISLDSLASPRGGATGQQTNYAFTNKNMAFEANTVEEALAKLEFKLNENYKETYKHELHNDGNSKKIVYKIEFDPEISGAVTGVVKNSFAVDDTKKFSFHPRQSITTVIMDIIKRSPSLCIRIGKTSEYLKKPFHQGVFVPIITPKVYPKDNIVEVRFVISLYKGGPTNVFEFDYFFADAGRNVDIQNYNVNISMVTALLAVKTKNGADTGANFSAQVPVQDINRYRNLMHEPVTQKFLPYKAVERSDIGRKTGDVAHPPSTSHRGTQNYNAMPLDAVSPLRMASNALADWGGSIEPEQVINIRGHYQLLELCVSRPDEIDPTKMTAGGGVWAKVNIFMPDGPTTDAKPRRRQFFYTGHYSVYVISNTFSSGVFTQQLRMIMNEGFGL